MKIKDFNKMLTSYEELLKAFDKAKPVIVKEREKDKSEGKGTSWLVGDSPRFYIRILVEMEKLINETWEDTAGRKAMSKVNGKSLGSLRQKLSKYMGESMADDVAKFEKEEDDGNEEEEEEVKAPKAKGHDSGSADLEKVTDYAEDKEILSTGKDLEDALQAIRNKQAQKTAEKVARERELAKVVIAKEDVELIVQVLDLKMLLDFMHKYDISGNGDP